MKAIFSKEWNSTHGCPKSGNVQKLLQSYSRGNVEQKLVLSPQDFSNGQTSKGKKIKLRAFYANKLLIWTCKQLLYI